MDTTTQQVAFRLPLEMVERLDRQVKRERVARPGYNVSRTDIVRTMLGQALDAAEATAKTSVKRKPRKAAT